MNYGFMLAALMVATMNLAAPQETYPTSSYDLLTGNTWKSSENVTGSNRRVCWAVVEPCKTGTKDITVPSGESLSNLRYTLMEDGAGNFLIIREA